MSVAVDFARCYHVGVRVADLDAAMSQLSAPLGVTWCSPQQRDQAVWIPGEGATALPLRFTYSAEGPQHIELLEGPPGSIWDGREQPGLHHVGVWHDDLKGGTEALLERGWALRLAQRPPDEGYGVFTYVQPPGGLLVELVWSGLEPMFERWFSGGELR